MIASHTTAEINTLCWNGQEQVALHKTSKQKLQLLTGTKAYLYLDNLSLPKWDYLNFKAQYLHYKKIMMKRIQ